MFSIKSISALCALTILSGCASIVGGSTQTVSVRTTKGEGEIAGAMCILTNDKGSWFVTSPGSVPIHRAYNDLSVVCKKDGEEPGSTSVKSTTKGMAFGNILFGGVIGAAVDAGTGAAYDYPPLITVSMGLTKLIEPSIGLPAVPNAASANANEMAVIE